MPEARARRSGLRPLVVSTAWGWRLELSLAMATALLLWLGNLLGPGGDVLIFGGTAIALWGWPLLRRRTVEALRRASTRRWLMRALRACDFVGPHGHRPWVRSMRFVPCGIRCAVVVPLGHNAGNFAQGAESLAAALRVREVRVTKDPVNSGVAHLMVVRRDPFAAPASAWPWQRVTGTSLWNPVPIGVDEEGRPVSITLPEHNLLLGGEPGAGKSAALSLLVAASCLDRDVTLTLLDGKQVELAAWAGCAQRFVGPDMDDAADILSELCGEMDRRYRTLLDEGRRKIERGDGLGLHVVVIDELAFYLRGGTRHKRNEVGESLRDLVSRGRAAGMVVLAATQKPSHDVIPTWIRDLFSFRLALRCTTPEASDTVLGQGWASQGFSAAAIDPAIRGVAFLLHEGGVPEKLRTHYLDDASISEIAQRAARLRGIGAGGGRDRDQGRS
ncbi:MAG: FtsK/SpoIIIE domain-containing protein [Acidimicrobiales bacterium]